MEPPKELRPPNRGVRGGKHKIASFVAVICFPRWSDEICCLLEKWRHFISSKTLLCFRLGLWLGLGLAKMRFRSTHFRASVVDPKFEPSVFTYLNQNLTFLKPTTYFYRLKQFSLFIALYRRNKVWFRVFTKSCTFDSACYQKKSTVEKVVERSKYFQSLEVFQNLWIIGILVPQWYTTKRLCFKNALF